MTTWGDLRAGDVILDKNDVPWTCGHPTTADGVHVKVPLKHADGRTPIVVKPATEEVRLQAMLAADGADPNWNSGLDPETNGGVILEQVQDAFGEDRVELIASETTEEQQAREAATPDTPLQLPVIDHPASLRSHLYVVHEFYVADVDSTLALQEHHRKQHNDYPDQGTPHTHEEEK